MHAKRFLSAGTALVVATFLGAACSPPSIDQQVSRYNTTKDRIEVIATRKPHLKLDIQAKVAEFGAEVEKAKATGGEEGSKQVGTLITRMEAYEKQIDPPVPGTAPAPGMAPGGNYGSTPLPGAPMGGPGMPPAPGGKLGGPAVAPMGGPGMPPAPAPVPAPAPAPAPGGFGGK
jgi:hypothetical protein